MGMPICPKPWGAWLSGPYGVTPNKFKEVKSECFALIGFEHWSHSSEQFKNSDLIADINSKNLWHS